MEQTGAVPVAMDEEQVARVERQGRLQALFQ
jgi:hypothetical protein